MARTLSRKTIFWEGTHGNPDSTELRPPCEAKDVAEQLEMSTAEIGLSVRTTNCLEERGIFTVNDLLNSTPEDLLSISNFGEKTLEEVYKALEAIGFYRRADAGRRPAAKKSSCRLGNRGDRPWRAVSDSTRRNAATGGPVPGWLGSVGEAVFFAVFLVWGCTWLVWDFVSVVIPEWRVNHEFVEHTCTVLEKRVGERPPATPRLCRPEIRIRLRVGRRPHTHWSTTSTGRYSSRARRPRPRWPALSRTGEYPCWYDPARPEWRCWCGATAGGTGWC